MRSPVPRSTSLVVLAVTALALTACGSTPDTSSATVASTTANTTGATDVPATDTGATTTVAADGTIVNTWVGPAADLTTLPIGTPHVSTTGAAVGNLYVCDSGNPNGGGAFKAGPWLDEAAGTWDLTQKVSVQGAVDWPMAQYSETIRATSG